MIHRETDPILLPVTGSVHLGHTLTERSSYLFHYILLELEHGVEVRRRIPCLSNPAYRKTDEGIPLMYELIDLSERVGVRRGSQQFKSLLFSLKGEPDLARDYDRILADIAQWEIGLSGYTGHTRC